MKKLYVFVIAVIMSSCAKDYTCECVQTSTINGVVVGTSVVSNNTIKSVNKSGATTACELSNISSSSGSEKLEVKCAIK